MGIGKRQHIMENGLTNVLKNVKIGVRAGDWRDAVREAGKLLVICGAAEERYIDAMIDMVEKYGPYCVIAPGLAVPHARPEDGALDDSLVVVVLNTPVEFGSADNDPVDILIAFASRSPDGHLKTLSGLARFLSQSGILDRIRHTATAEELRRLFENSQKASCRSPDDPCEWRSSL